ncbi:MAG: hypothetical protein RR355_00150 [Oscillospiraceae bacterium]
MNLANADFLKFRNDYKTFNYNGYHLSKDDDFIYISYDFEIEKLCEFHPTTKIDIKNLTICNDFNSSVAKKIIFNLGMVELVSYFKIACPKTVNIRCGYLDKEDILWWKKLYFGGLSEFFYINEIETDFDSFMDLKCTCKEDKCLEVTYNKKDINLIPIGGGKDSAVTCELLKSFGPQNKFFTVNNQKARTETVLAAGYSEDDIVRAYREIDKNLLRLNKEGFLNGHTPFSAIVAFLSLYSAYLIGGEYIVLSNESSANESNIEGTAVNHQYSKSYEFERDFTNYVHKNIVKDIQYFSLLRPFAEIQIAKRFSLSPWYHSIFRSCNRGSKQNIWCCKCAKCLFVYAILSPFIEREKMIEIFGSDMLNDAELLNDFDGLLGFSPVKPFECVGTVSEIQFALFLVTEKLKKEKKELPLLLKRFDEKANYNVIDKNILNEFNELNNVPLKFIDTVKEMQKDVAENN